MVIHKKEVISTMNKQVLVVLVLLLQVQLLWAGEVFKWTDENGRVHFGDQRVTPNIKKSEKIQIDTQINPDITLHDKKNQQDYEATQKSKEENSQASFTEVLPPFEERSWVYVGFVQTPSYCREIAEKIALLPSGTPFQSLAFEFEGRCPKITYECVWYKRHSDRNKCYWTKKQGNSIVMRKVYD